MNKARFDRVIRRFSEYVKVGDYSLFDMGSWHGCAFAIGVLLHENVWEISEEGFPYLKEAPDEDPEVSIAGWLDIPIVDACRLFVVEPFNSQRGCYDVPIGPISPRMMLDAMTHYRKHGALIDWQA